MRILSIIPAVILAIVSAYAADVKISDLPETNAPSASAVLPIVDAGVTWKVQKNNLLGSLTNWAKLTTNAAGGALWQFDANGITFTTNGVAGGSPDTVGDAISSFAEGLDPVVPNLSIMNRTNLSFIIGSSMGGSMFHNGSGMLGEFWTNGVAMQIGVDDENFYGPFMSWWLAPAKNPGDPPNLFGKTNAMVFWQFVDQSSIDPWAAGGFSVAVAGPTPANEAVKHGFIWAYPSAGFQGTNLMRLDAVAERGASTFPPERFGIDTNGLVRAFSGFSSTATDAALPFGTDGVTNTFGKLAVGRFDGTNVIYKVLNNAGTPVYTNAVAIGRATELLQAGGKIVVTSGTVIGTLQPL